MRYLILSDIHSNLEALEAVLGRVKDDYDSAICLGDTVGYGADPNAAVDWVRENAAMVIRGNHDKACAGLDDLEWFNHAAKASALWTQSALSPENREWLKNLPMGPAVVADFQIAHGSPLDEDEYLLQLDEARLMNGFLETRVTFFGHTHVQGGFLLQRSQVMRIPPVAKQEDWKDFSVGPDAYLLVNPGSVGQPRDVDPRAAFCVYDTEAAVIRYFRVPYDVAAAQRKIREAGLPDVLARRLSVGQ